MDNLIQMVKAADHFGGIFQLNFQPSLVKYKSTYGGFATIIIYLIAFGYFVYLLIAWQSNQILPKITTTTIFRPEGNEIQLDSPPYRLNAALDGDQWEYFNNSKNLFQSHSVLYEDGNLLQFEQEQPNCNFPQFKLHSIALKPFFCMEKKPGFGMKVQQRPNNISADSYYSLEMHQCKNGENCISNEDFELFITDHFAYAQLQVINQFYDHHTEQFQMIPTDYWLLISKGFTIYCNVKLKITELEIDDGILFPNIKNYKYISKIDLLLQGTKWKTEDDPYVMVEATVDRETQVIQIQYIKISELLAQFSSILSTLLLSGILFNYYNNLQMKQLYLEEVGKIYYHNFSWKKSKTELLNGKKFQSNSKIEPFQSKSKINKEIFQKLEIQLMEKCSFIQILTEISKLQQIIALIVPKEKLEKIIKLKLNFIEINNELGNFTDRDQLLIFQNLYQKELERNFSQDRIFSQEGIDQLAQRQIDENQNILISSKQIEKLIH